RINAVCPAVIDTDMYRRAVEAEPRKAESVARLHPIGRIGRAEEVAAAVLYLCSDAASFTTGIAPPVDGGSTCIRTEVSGDPAQACMLSRVSCRSLVTSARGGAPNMRLYSRLKWDGLS